jgi:phage terminase large subunit GpA-like protein
MLLSASAAAASSWQLAPALAIFEPREAVRSLDWARDHASTEAGHPYDHFAYPHLGAPGGPLAALDCRQYLEIWLQWGTRLGKSFVGQVGAMKTADVEPCPMLYVGPTEDLAYQVVDRTVRMIEHCDRLKHQLPERRDSRLIELAFCRMFVGWPRSPATLADKDIGFGHGGEIDKWVQQKTSTEAHPLELFFERFKNRVAYKVLLEGSPGLKGSSPIEAGRLSGTNAHLHVPCQRCGRFQILTKSQIIFEQLGGRPDAELAAKTARYVCPHCHGENHDEDRGPMMRSGVWVPEGCGCDDDKARAAVERNNASGGALWRGFSEDADWLIGKPVRDGEAYSSQLSSLYALSVTWGTLAKQMVRADLSPEKKRNWVNGWLAETYERGRRVQSWETLGEKLMAPHDVGRGELPAGFRLLTAGVDKQESKYVVDVDAWAAGRTSHTVDYFEADDEEELLRLLDEEYRVAADGTSRTDGQRLKISLSLLDSGFRPKDVHGLIDRAKKRGIRIVPCRGSTRSIGPGVMYEKRRLGKKTARPGAPYVLVDTGNTQDWIDRQLCDTKAGVRGGTSLFRAELGEHQDYLEQLLNEAPVDEAWQIVDENVPVDYRDAKRYAAVAMLLVTRGKEIKAASGHESGVRSWQESAAEAAGPEAPKKRPRKSPDRTSPLRRPGGWLNMR